MTEKKEKEKSESKVQSQLDQWRDKLRELEKKMEGLSDKAREGFSTAIGELKAQMDKAQDNLSRLREKSGSTWKEGMERLHKALEGIETGYKGLTEQIDERLNVTKEEIIRLQERVKESHVWEGVEKGFDEAWERSKKVLQWVYDEVGKATKKARLSIENHRIQGQITKLLARIGNEVYTKVIKEGKRSFVPNSETKELLTRVRELEEELERNTEALKKEEGA